MSFLRQRGKIWHLCEYAGGKTKERSLKTTDAQTAKDYWHTYEQNKARLTLGLAAKNLPIISLIDKYREIHKAPGTKSRDDLTFKNFMRLCPIETLEEFTDEKIQQYISRRHDTDKVENSTINRDLTTLKHFGKMLRRWKYVLANPLEDIQKLKAMEPDTQYFTADNISLIMKHSKGIWYDMFLIAINTGCRENELLTWTWTKSLNLNTRTVVIQAPKTKKIRYIPMTDVLYEHLLKMKAKSKHGAVICFPDGHQPSPGTITHHWIRLLLKLGIKRPGLSFRNTRHTCATYLMASGVNRDTIQKILGHSSSAMTDRYAKMDIRELKTAFNKLSYGKIMATKKPTK